MLLRQAPWLTLALFVFVLSVATTASAREPGEQPNILFVMVDDLGKEWVSCYGAAEIETPNLDALAAGGMKFHNAYSMPQCTPTRVTLLTGQYPWRNGWCNHWDVPRWGAGCHFDWKHNVTFARQLRNYTPRVIRDKRYKAFVQEGQITKLVDLKTDLEEQDDLLDSEDANVAAARKKFEAVIRTCPEKDARPQYEPTPPQPWDRKVTGDTGKKARKYRKKGKKARRPETGR